MPNLFLEGLQRPAILQNNSGLPDYSEANEGDVLQIQSNEPVWGAVDALPEIEETDEGKVLAVDQGEAVWADAPSGLPEITNADEGKVLTVVDNSGTLEAEWAEPSGGGDDVVYSGTVSADPIPLPPTAGDAIDMMRFLRFYVDGNLISSDMVEFQDGMLYVLINDATAVVIYYDEQLDAMAVKTGVYGGGTPPTVQFEIKMPDKPMINAILQQGGYISIKDTAQSIMATTMSGYVVSIFIHGTYNGGDYYSTGIMNAEYVQSTDTYTFSSTAKVMGDSITFTVNSETGAISGQAGTT